MLIQWIKIKKFLLFYFWKLYKIITSINTLKFLLYFALTKAIPTFLFRFYQYDPYNYNYIHELLPYFLPPLPQQQIDILLNASNKL